MKNIGFYLLPIIVFCFCNLSCQNSQSNDVSVNASNAAAKNIKTPQLETAQISTENATEKSQEPKNTDERETSQVNSPESASGGKFENRCGWFSNPTPGNAWLDDKDGEWLIGAQGGFQAEGDWAEFSDDEWVKTNVNYGYGCACLRVKTDYKSRRILEIASAKAKPLAACRKDKSLKEPN